ncbi:phosphatidylinositol 4,5-bisphosphate 3-kinase catalytic subunit beta isoform-like [Orbicella faveolata]|uniref:phosphatidylinositol 4,5-bisphosphate 3-kinase catalytic subunit beta isoform-like n=1 Tax=Orbicella faveolata TaxID=48498 RepID=UPI0009E5D433|nr:phosphatidylinositol 4,5-bisphosphate 3-kinase catalytic subunit beta isoform-like [Orbicella faveolata]
MADQLNPVGTVVSNINTATSVSLSIEFPSYSHAVVYPSFEKIAELAAEVTDFNIFGGADETLIEQLRQIVNREPLAPIFEQEKELVWERRIDCREHFPHALAKLLCCVKWNSNKDVALVCISKHVYCIKLSFKCPNPRDVTMVGEFCRTLNTKCRMPNPKYMFCFGLIALIFACG